jgi:uncharacterized protein YjiS (DUF1127 family)
MLSMLLSALRQLRVAYGEWRRRQAAFDELNALDDRSLADIGITRSDIPFIFSQGVHSRDVQEAAKAQATGMLRRSLHRAA